MADIFDMTLFDDDSSDESDSRPMMDDDVAKDVIKAIKEDDTSVISLLKTSLWDLRFDGAATSPNAFNTNLEIILQQSSKGDSIETFLRNKISEITLLPVPTKVVQEVLGNTNYSGKRISNRTRCCDISHSDLEELVKNVLTAYDGRHPWYQMWHFSRRITGNYHRWFDPTSYQGYFRARDPKDMLGVALNICNMSPADSICDQASFLTGYRYRIVFSSLSDLHDRKFSFKPSIFNDKFIVYDGSTIKLKALSLYDIQLLKFLIKHFNCDASRSIYQFLSSMMLSERDVALAHEIGWFSGIPWAVFEDAREEMYLLPEPSCEANTYLAILHISKHSKNLLKGFVRDFKFQSSTSPANIWIAVTSLIFALVSVIQFFMGL
ncbi:hypothetical protein DFQ26_005325 [Actinomortierella ambigua]|nr:hypothetical protein DFQ26_005325 [Actinomortierella ambigua]